MAVVAPLTGRGTIVAGLFITVVSAAMVPQNDAAGQGFLQASQGGDIACPDWDVYELQTDHLNTFHFTADCKDYQQGTASNCILTHAYGYANGSVTCDGTTGSWVVVAATENQCAEISVSTDGETAGAECEAVGASSHPTCTFACMDSMFVLGDPEIKCSSDGVWDAHPTCTDVNECVAVNCDFINGTCINAIGSYMCVCYEGFTLNENGYSCDENQCPVINITAATNITNAFAGASCPGGGVKSGPTCTFECAAGMQMVGTQTITCDLDGLWQEYPICVNIDECVGANDCDAVNGGCIDTIGSYTCTCNAGYLLNPDGHTCDEIQCSSIEVTTDGPAAGASCPGGGVTSSPTCTFSCDTIVHGMNLVGDATIACDINGTWASFPTCACDAGYAFDQVSKTCETIQCSSIEITANASTAGASCPGGAAIGSPTCTFSCPSGTSLQGDSTITCDLNGTWPTFPTCSDVDECAGANDCDPVNGACVDTLGSYICACNDAFTLNADGHTCDENQCPSISVTASGETAGASCPGGGASGSPTCTFTCETNMNMDAGDATITCAPDGTWPAFPNCSCDPGFSFNADEHKCEENICRSISVNASGATAGAECAGGSASGLPTCKFSCEDGHDLVGAATISCDLDGNWPDFPTCSNHDDGGTVCSGGGNIVKTYADDMYGLKDCSEFGSCGPGWCMNGSCVCTKCRGYPGIPCETAIRKRVCEERKHCTWRSDLDQGKFCVFDTHVSLSWEEHSNGYDGTTAGVDIEVFDCSETSADVPTCPVFDVTEMHLQLDTDFLELYEMDTSCNETKLLLKEPMSTTANSIYGLTYTDKTVLEANSPFNNDHKGWGFTGQSSTQYLKAKFTKNSWLSGEGFKLEVKCYPCGYFSQAYQEGYPVVTQADPELYCTPDAGRTPSTFYLNADSEQTVNHANLKGYESTGGVAMVMPSKTTDGPLVWQKYLREMTETSQGNFSYAYNTLPPQTTIPCPA